MSCKRFFGEDYLEIYEQSFPPEHSAAHVEGIVELANGQGMMSKTGLAAGVVVAALGALVAVYSFPFVTWLAFSLFVLGIVGIGFGLWLVVVARRTPS